ncbi:MAG: reverse transcriptase domain-containing protein, partial [Cyanobacteria bacterium J06649_11]
MDALVLKAMAIVLGEHLKPHLSNRVFHLAGSGGMKAAVREVAANLEKNQFVFRTDVKGYYASINHHILMEIVERYVEDKAVIALLWGYLRRYVSDGGKFIDITQGISLGCPLSPLIGALFLKPL